SVEGHRLKGRITFVWAQDAASKKEETKMKEALSRAITEFRKANSLDPTNTPAVVYLARVLTADRQYGEAERLYLGLVGREKTQVAAYAELYRIYMFLEQPDKAEAILRRAIENNPKRYDLLINLAQHFYSRKNRDEVVRVLDTLKSHAKEYPQAFEQVGAFY